MLDHLLGLAVSLPLLGFVSWTWVVHVQPERQLHRCHSEIRRLETEIYGQVMSGSLVREEDTKELEQFTDRLAKELTPPRLPSPRVTVRGGRTASTYSSRQVKYKRQQIILMDEMERWNRPHEWKWENGKYHVCGICGMGARKHERMKKGVHHLR